jgi:hypothetical protein
MGPNGPERNHAGVVPWGGVERAKARLRIGTIEGECRSAPSETERATSERITGGPVQLIA